MKVYRPVLPEGAGEVATPTAVDGPVERIGIVDDRLDPYLIDGVVEQLQALLPDASVRTWAKPVGTSPAPESLIEEMAREVQVALAGVGM